MSEKELNHPNRGLDLEAAENVRDLGGYSTADGRVTRWGQFVRAGDLHQLSDADRQKLLAYGIGTVIDLRMGWEIESQPNVFASGDDVRFLNHDFWGDRFDNYRSANRTAAPVRKLADLYCAGLVRSGFVMGEIMATLADDADHGYLFHCRSGKDRTGLVAAMLLAVAGVPEAVIAADFALTAGYLKSTAINPIDPRAPGAWQRGAEPATMALTLGFVRDNYGDVPGYLRQMGVSDKQIARLRVKLLED